MKFKQFIKQFLPPIYYQLRGKNILTQVDKLYLSLQELNERKNIRLTGIDALAQEPLFKGSLLMAYSDVYEPNYYGAFQVLQKYAGISYWNFSPQKLSIQHGIICEMFDWEKKKLGNINYVWSSEIKRMYAEYTKNPHVFAIGSPFFYAESLLSEKKIQEEKKRLGRNLLAFPTHSVYYADVQYNASNFVDLLKEQQKSFDTVRVCLYWRDIQRGLVKPYMDAGFECVCCGHIYDPFFLERQRALFEIADATISNAIGSYIGYSIFLNKPHWLVPDEFKLNDINGTAGKDEVEIWDTSPKYAEVRQPFLNNSQYVITEEQRSVVDKYWGISSIKKPDEILDLIKQAYKVSEELSK